MKKIFKYIGLFLSVIMMGAFTACQVEELNESAEMGLNIKVFFPEKVVAGTQMTISGSGLKDVVEVVFPGEVSVTDFKIVNDGMIRVTAPKGISADGGVISVRTESEQVQSSRSLTLGATKISGYSRQAGETVNGAEQITVYGTDLEFINSVELLDAEGNPNLISDKDFYRKGTSTVIFTVPRKNIFDGTFSGKIYTCDGKEFLMPELTYKPVQDAGHWETKKTIIWENEDNTPIPSWGNTFRFANVESSTGEEIHAFTMDEWAIIKEGTFRIAVDVNESSNIRITTGWWSCTYGGTEYNAIELVQEDEDGTKYIEINIKEEGNLYDNIDVQHLLFTGSDYTLLEIYVLEWVEGSTNEPVVFWENPDPEGYGLLNWGSVYRFGLDGTDTNSECLTTFPQEVWDKVKSGFYMTAQSSDWVQMRITTGWWSTTWTGDDIKTGDERIVDNGDGTYNIEINFSGDPILDLLDAQHLLLTGSGYTPLKLYYYE